MRPLLGPPRDPARTYHNRRFHEVSEAAGDSPNSLTVQSVLCLVTSGSALRLHMKIPSGPTIV